jgi:hypothetical protein
MPELQSCDERCTALAHIVPKAVVARAARGLFGRRSDDAKPRVAREQVGQFIHSR